MNKSMRSLTVWSVRITTWRCIYPLILKHRVDFGRAFAFWNSGFRNLTSIFCSPFAWKSNTLYATFPFFDFADLLCYCCPVNICFDCAMLSVNSLRVYVCFFCVTKTSVFTFRILPFILPSNSWKRSVANWLNHIKSSLASSVGK